MTQRGQRAERGSPKNPAGGRAYDWEELVKSEGSPHPSDPAGPSGVAAVRFGGRANNKCQAGWDSAPAPSPGGPFSALVSHQKCRERGSDLLDSGEQLGSGRRAGGGAGQLLTSPAGGLGLFDP